MIGIARPEFDFPRDVDIWTPLRTAWPDVEKNVDVRVFRAVARLREGVSVGRARARLSVLARQYDATLRPGSEIFTPVVTPMLDEVYGAARPAVWILLGAVLLVLLIACANVANLLLARSTDRGRELAIRAALGADRRQVIKLLLGEAAVLAASGAAFGLLLAAAGIQLLVALAPPEVPRIAAASLDLGVLAFGVALASATVLVFGLGPALIASRRDPNAISADYFRTMGIRVVRGRDFSTADNHTTAGVVIINEGTARRHWPGGDAVGRQIRMSPDAKAPWLTVVGVVKDVRYREWEAARPDFYIPYLQRAQHRSDFVVKTHGDPGALISAVRREVLALDSNQPVSNVTTLEALVDAALARWRFNGVVLTVLAACAVLLAGIGVYGVFSYSVAQRSAEIGIRMAVGATSTRIVRLITGEALRTVAAGAGIGLGAALLLSDLIGSLLFEVSNMDPSTYAGAGVALLAVGALASAVPARRASTVDLAKVLHGG